MNGDAPELQISKYNYGHAIKMPTIILSSYHLPLTGCDLQLDAFSSKDASIGKNVKFHFSARDARAMNPHSGELHHSLLVRNSSSLITHHHLLQFLLHHYYYLQCSWMHAKTQRRRGEAHKWFRRWLWKTLKNLLPNQRKNTGNARVKMKISR